MNEALSRIPPLVRSIPDIIREPAANRTQALLLLAILVAIVLMLVVSTILFLIRPAKKARPPRTLPGGEKRAGGRRASPRLAWLVVLLILAATYLLTGITTGSRPACESCHPDNPHGQMVGDPHGSVACVACHERGGPIRRTTIGALGRLEHLVVGRTGAGSARARLYGHPIPSDSCFGCHRAQIGSVTVASGRGVRMSHREVLAAGAECVDCHTLFSGTVSARTVGMAPCLRCHAKSASDAECDVCHVGEPAQAAMSSEPTGGLYAKALVPEPRCDGCHESQEECDACHGIRMPHSTVFKAYQHARPATIDIWDNGGKTCARCHQAGHRPCSNCHTSGFPSHPSDFKYTHADSDWGASCSCHGWDVRKRQLLFCEICHAANPKRSAQATD